MFTRIILQPAAIYSCRLELVYKIGGGLPMKRPKEKGNAHERKVAAKLTEWAGAKFMRTPMSGAIHNFNDRRVVSDIVAPLSIGKFPFSIEAKNVEYDWTFSTIIKGTSMFWEHWNQAVTDAEREELIPMLVFTKNYQDIYVAIPQDVFTHLFFDKQRPDYIVVRTTKDWSVPIVIMNFDTFLKSVTLQEVLNLCN